MELVIALVGSSPTRRKTPILKPAVLGSSGTRTRRKRMSTIWCCQWWLRGDSIRQTGWPSFLADALRKSLKSLCHTVLKRCGESLNSLVRRYGARWLIDLLICRFIDILIFWLIYWYIDILIFWFFDFLIYWLVKFVCLFVCLFVGWFVGLLVGWLVDWLTDWLNAGWLAGSLTHYGWLTDWLKAGWLVVFHRSVLRMWNS